jgi:hypothetical protein
MVRTDGIEWIHDTEAGQGKQSPASKQPGIVKFAVVDMPDSLTDFDQIRIAVLPAYHLGGPRKHRKAMLADRKCIA